MRWLRVSKLKPKMVAASCNHDFDVLVQGSHPDWVTTLTCSKCKTAMTLEEAFAWRSRR